MGSDLFLSLALLFLASADSSLAQKAASALEVEEGAPLTVECPLRVEQRARWRLDGREPPADVVPVSEAAAAGRLVARLHTARARLAHAGLYSCGPDEEQRVHVAVLPRRARPTPAPVPGADDSKAPATTEASAPSAAPALGVVLTLQYYDVGRPFALNCSDPEVKPGTPFFWKKNGTAIEELQELHGRYVLEEGGAVLRVTGRTHESDFGNYTCGLGGVTDQLAGWEVRGRPVAKLQPNNNVVEGQKLRMVCKVVGKPYPAVEWRVRNDSTDENRTELVTAVLGERVRFEPSEQGVPGAELVVEAAERSDAAVYVCIPLADEGVRAETTLRVKDKYAALWPFLGICAEVFVLCAIILIYEKRRTKPELDDSDTDNHDQKKS